MGNFIVYPAIDLRGGKVVRLKQGRIDRQTVFSSDPIKIAEKWISQGAEWLHIVNLDGAFGDKTVENEKASAKILNKFQDRVKVQMGGGIRSISQIKSALSMGVNRVVLGTAVIENPEFGEEAIFAFGADNIAFGFDTLDGELMTQGWKKSSELSSSELALKLVSSGAKTLIYTNIDRDGMSSGVDWETALDLKRDFPIEIIASGGTSSIDDIRKVKEAGLNGIIIGRALYEETFTLTEALDVR